MDCLTYQMEKEKHRTVLALDNSRGHRGWNKGAVAEEMHSNGFLSGVLMRWLFGVVFKMLC